MSGRGKVAGTDLGDEERSKEAQLPCEVLYGDVLKSDLGELSPAV